MKFPNKYLRNVKPYKLASHKIWKVQPEERTSILKLDWNESTIPPSPLVKERIYKLMEEPMFFNLYPSTLNEELLSLLSDYVGLPMENLQYFNSSDSLHEYICKVFISVGDPVVILGHHMTISGSPVKPMAPMYIGLIMNLISLLTT